jgi:hypothetical protein
MFFDNRLTGDDMQRMHDNCPNPPPPLLLAGSFAALLEAIDTYTQESEHPVMSGMLGLTDREKVILTTGRSRSAEQPSSSSQSFINSR